MIIKIYIHYCIVYLNSIPVWYSFVISAFDLFWYMFCHHNMWNSSFRIREQPSSMFKLFYTFSFHFFIFTVRFSGTSFRVWMCQKRSFCDLFVCLEMYDWEFCFDFSLFVLNYEIQTCIFIFCLPSHFMMRAFCFNYYPSV